MATDFQNEGDGPMTLHHRIARRGEFRLLPWAGLLALLAFSMLGSALAIYNSFRILVPPKHVAVLIAKTGNDVPNDAEIAPDTRSKGVQRKLLAEGRWFRNPFFWDWEVIPQIEIGKDKLGVRVRLVGKDLPYGEFLAREDDQKGIVPGALRPGRYAINPYVERIEADHEPVTIPAGFKGVVTNLAGPLPPDPNVLLVPSKNDGHQYRGVQSTTLDPGIYYFNPYEKRVSQVDCRSQRFNLAEKKDMGFPSKDGFWVRLDGIVEFRVKPEKAAEVFVTYNEDVNGDRIEQEIISKVILPNARSFCRLEGSKSLGREFIQGSTRIAFQENFQQAMRDNCEPLGIEIIQALITKITPPNAIAEPVRAREIAKQEEKQFQQQILQQESEKNLAIEVSLVKRRTEIVQADQEVIRRTTEAEQAQEVAVTKADQELAVAELNLDAAKDRAAAVVARGKAAAQVVEFQNAAEAAGWKRAVAAFGGDGDMYAQFVLFEKMASAYRNIMVNTANSPIMRIFDRFVPAKQGVTR